MNTIATGQYIQNLRKQHGWSQKELADRLNVSFQAVSKWERGDNLPDSSILLYMAKLLNTTTDKILSGGSTVVQKSKRVSVSDEKEGFFSLGNMTYFFGEIVLLPLRGMKEYANKIQQYLYEIADDVDVSIIDLELLRFQTGDAKAVLCESVRGKDVYLVVDMGNYSETYNIHGYENHMSPDEHYMDLMRTISAIGGKAARINVISPFLYAAKQDRRILRESLDCAIALQQLYSVGVSNIMAFDVHDDRVQNAVPFIGFDKLMPIYQAIKSLRTAYPDVSFDRNHTVVVSPDFGGMERNYTYSDELGIDLGVFYKRRSHTDFSDGNYAVQIHKYFGPDVAGKDVLVIDDIIASGETMLDVVSQLSALGAKRIFLVATFGFFTKGTAKFDEAYNSGILEAVFITNASYVNENIISSPWYKEIDVIKYISYYIYCVNSGYSVAKLIDPHQKIQNYLNRGGQA